jgi:hypothetical protein
MPSYEDYEAIRVSKAFDEVLGFIKNEKELTDLASGMSGLGYHTWCLGLEMQKDADPTRKEIGRRMYEVGIHWSRQGENLQAIATARYRSNAAD